MSKLEELFEEIEQKRLASLGYGIIAGLAQLKAIYTQSLTSDLFHDNPLLRQIPRGIASDSPFIPIKTKK